MAFPFTQYRKLYFALSGLLVLGSIIVVAVFGLPVGIEFTGGSILELAYEETVPTETEIVTQLVGIETGQIVVQPTGEHGVIIRFQGVGEALHQDVLQALSATGSFEELRFESIGPVIGTELRQKAWILALLSVLAIVIYIAIAFRNISWPRKSWEYGLVALAALVHDAVITVGVLAVVGIFMDLPITIPIIVALLTVAGYSVNDTVVIFDRIRENLTRHRSATFAEVIDISLQQTFSRSVNTSMTTLFVLVAIFILGGQALAAFALTLMVGVIIGTYSSIFVAAPLLVSLPKRGK